MNPGNKGRRKNRNFTVRKLSEMRRIAGINGKKYILKKKNNNFFYFGQNLSLNLSNLQRNM